MSVISSVNSDQGKFYLDIFDHKLINFFQIVCSNNAITEIEFTTPKSTGTFFRFVAKKFKPTAHCCHICRYNFKLGDDLANHLKVHRSKIVLRMSSLSER